jgi:hypothetical protein
MRSEWQRDEGDWVGMMPINHPIFFGQRGISDLCFVPMTGDNRGSA